MTVTIPKRRLNTTILQNQIDPVSVETLAEEIPVIFIAGQHFANGTTALRLVLDSTEAVRSPEYTRE